MSTASRKPGRKSFDTSTVVLVGRAGGEVALADLAVLAETAHVGKLRIGAFPTAGAGTGPARDGGFPEGLSESRNVLFGRVVGRAYRPAPRRLAGRKTVRLAELSAEHWIAGSTTVEDTLIAACLRSGFRPAVRYVVQEWTTKQGLVAAGLGVTLVPGLLCGAIRSDLALVRLRKDEAATRPVTVIMGERVVAQRFLPYLVDSAEKLLVGRDRGYLSRHAVSHSGSQRTQDQ